MPYIASDILKNLNYLVTGIFKNVTKKLVLLQ